MARAIAERLAPLLKQEIAIENHPGKSNTLAVDLTTKSVDGHTMVMGGATSNAIAPNLLKLAYDNHRELVPVAFVGSVPNVLVVGNQVAAHTVSELVALAKKQPNTVRYASSGIGSTQHIAAELFQDATGLSLVHVPYSGSAEAQSDLIDGNVQMSFDTMPSVIGAIKAGKLRALAVTSQQRSPLLPQVPSMAEQGLTNIHVNAWYGIYMPAKTPRAVINKVNSEVNRVLSLPETQARMQNIGAELRTMTQSQFATFNLAEYMRYHDIISKKKMRVD